MLAPLEREQPGLAKSLTEKRRQWIQRLVQEVQSYVEQEGLSFIPVFGGFSLVHSNHQILGKPDQASVREGADVVSAVLKDHSLGFGVDTVLQGTPEHPGAHAGLIPQQGEDVQGVLLKLDLERAERLLFELLFREDAFLTDLRDPLPDDPLDRTTEYVPSLKDVTLEDGTVLKALTFVLNPVGAKTLFTDDPSPKERVATLAYLFQGSGGYRLHGDPSARTYLGNSRDYWIEGHVKPRLASGQSPLPEVVEALARAEVIPTEAELRTLPSSTYGPVETDRLRNTARALLEGAKLPENLEALQKPEAESGIIRLPVPFDNPGALERLAAAANLLLSRGILDEGGRPNPEHPEEAVFWLTTGSILPSRPPVHAGRPWDADRSNYRPDVRAITAPLIGSNRNAARSQAGA